MTNYVHDERPFVIFRQDTHYKILGHGTQLANGTVVVWRGLKGVVERHDNIETVFNVDRDGPGGYSWCSNTNGEWSIPYGADGRGRFVRTMDTHTGTLGWVWVVRNEPKWHGHVFRCEPDHLVEGDSLVATGVATFDKLVRSPAPHSRNALLERLMRASHLWVARRTSSRATEPDVIELSMWKER